MKSMTVKLFIGLVSMALMFSFFGCSKSKAKRVTVKGSTTVLPITQKAAEAFKKETGISVFVEGSGSGNGIKALIDGSCDVANSSREMKDNELETAKAKGIKVKEIVVAYDMIVPVVHPSNAITKITLNQLKAIYDGSISDWSKAGGEKGKIIVISRDTSSGTYEVWHEKVMKKSDVRNDALLQASNGAVLSAVAGNAKAMGYVGFGYINTSVKPLDVDGVTGTLENGKSGKFPISRKLYMYVNENKMSEEIKKFVDFLLSDIGQKLVTDAGFISLK